jgi:predicted DNA-binding transcriptional regulator AlpA
MPVQRYLRTPDAALHLGLSARTLEKHRCYGTGPVFRRLGGRVVYALHELEAWAAQGIRHSTSDPGVGTVHPALPGRGNGQKLVQNKDQTVPRNTVQSSGQGSAQPAKHRGR